MSNEYKPDYLVSPGEVVQDYIDAWANERGFEYHWYERYGAVADIDDETMDRLCAGDQPITPTIAEKLTKLGRPAHFWINLERQYQADRARLSGIDPWIPVAEQEPPKDGVSILVKCEDEEWEGCPWVSAWFCGANKGWLYYGGPDDPDITVVEFDQDYPFTHWTPIPGGEK
jgi:plasmid maintenance system antidote protein VapI